MRGGLHPDLLGEAGGWEPKLWTYAVSAVVLYTRAAADRTSLPVPQVALKVADGAGSPVASCNPVRLTGPRNPLVVPRGRGGHDP